MIFFPLDSPGPQAGTKTRSPADADRPGRQSLLNTDPCPLPPRHPDAGRRGGALKSTLTLGDVRDMERPPLTVVLSSVLSAAVENTNRPALLGVMAETADERRAEVIPLPRRSPESDDPSPAA
jgi:hypothetical protein